MFKVWCSDRIWAFNKTFFFFATQLCGALAARCISSFSIIIHCRSPSELIASEHQWVVCRQLGVLVLLTLSHPWGFWKRGNGASWLAGSAQRALWSSSHMSRPPCLQISTDQKRREGERKRQTEGGRANTLFLTREIQCSHMEADVINMHVCSVQNDQQLIAFTWPPGLRSTRMAARTHAFALFFLYVFCCGPSGPQSSEGATQCAQRLCSHT